MTTQIASYDLTNEEAGRKIEVVVEEESTEGGTMWTAKFKEAGDVESKGGDVADVVVWMVKKSDDLIDNQGFEKTDWGFVVTFTDYSGRYPNTYAKWFYGEKDLDDYLRDNDGALVLSRQSGWHPETAKEALLATYS